MAVYILCLTNEGKLEKSVAIRADFLPKEGDVLACFPEGVTFPSSNRNNFYEYTNASRNSYVVERVEHMVHKEKDKQNLGSRTIVYASKINEKIK